MTTDGGLRASGRARSRSPSRPPSRSASRSLSRSPSRRRGGSVTLHTNIGNVNKRNLCIEGFFYANQYEGPYGKHIAVITHTGTGVVIVGIILAVTAFAVLGQTAALEPMRVMAVVLLIIGMGISVSTTTVYTRAHKNSRGGSSGRLNLSSQDILLKIALSFSVFLALTGIIVVPIGFALSASTPIFNYLKYIGVGFIVLGVVGFVVISVYGKVWSRGQRSGTRSRGGTQHPRRASRVLPRSRTNSEVVPEIRVDQHSDTGSELGTGSDITEAFTRRGSLVTPSYVITSTGVEPPPYCIRDPHPGGWSDTGSSVLAVSATHSMVTLLQYAYADELDITPPPPYSEAQSLPTVCVTPVNEINDEDSRAVGVGQDSGAVGGQLNSPSTTSIGLNSSQPSHSGTTRPNCSHTRPNPSHTRPNARSLSSMLAGIQTDSGGLTVPDT